MLALVAAPIGTAGEVPSLAGRNGGNPPFLVHRSGDVAPPDVARHAESRRNPPFSVPGPQIANLTTRASWAPRSAAAPAPNRAGRGGVSPFRPRALDPMPVARGGVRLEKTFEIEGPAFGGRSPVSGGRETSHLHLGSGVWALQRRSGLSRDRAESGRQWLGQGEGGAHRPLDVGKSPTLWIGGGDVNVREVRR